MTKLLFYPSSFNNIKESVDLVDGFIVGIENLCVNCSLILNKEEVIEIINYCNLNNKDIFISLNKNMFNSDLDLLKETLLFLKDKKTNGIFFYDLSILKLTKELSIDIPLVWSQEHLTTNYLTCNYYYEKGCKYVYLSSEITLKEIFEISKKTNLEIILPIFGYLPMFNSKRHIVNNYIETFNLIKKNDLNYMYKENNYYPILDDKLGTTAYSSHILNGLEELLVLKENNISHVTINSFNIDNDTMKKVLKMYSSINRENVNELNNQIKTLIPNLDKGFLYKETIYRVKKNDK